MRYENYVKTTRTLYALTRKGAVTPEDYKSVLSELCNTYGEDKVCSAMYFITVHADPEKNFAWKWK